MRMLTSLFKHSFLGAFGLLMVYPILWLFFGSFKKNNEVFGTANFFPSEFMFVNYYNGWFAFRGLPFQVFFQNSLAISILVVIGTLISCSMAAYAFARIPFPLKKVLFVVLMMTIMFPKQIILVPQYLLFARFGWLNSYMPIVFPAFFGEFHGAFFIFLLIQFMRGIPMELDEAAIVDGCGRFRYFYSIMLPLLKPALFTVAIFAFMWSWDDFFSHLLYINSVKLYPLTLALNMFVDDTSITNWGSMFAMSFLSILPLVLIFLFCQRYFVEGISTTGLKG